MININTPRLSVFSIVIFSALSVVTAVDAGCCSNDHRVCQSTAPDSPELCSTFDNEKYVWLPEGAFTECLVRNKVCSSHDECCGMLVCDGKSGNVNNKRCTHPVDICSTFTYEEFCLTRSSCEWKDDSCVPNFDYSIKDEPKKPEVWEEDPGCCSSNFRTCNSNTLTKTEMACRDKETTSGADAKLMWLPDGPLEPDSCISHKQSGDKSCTVHEDCCGMAVCDGAASNVNNKICRHPIDMCNTFKDESFCITRSTCSWEDDKCVPNFTHDLYDPTLKAQLENWEEDPGCCSQNHLECKTNTNAKTYELCQEVNDKKWVWIPEGDKQVPNADTCFKKGVRTACATHEDCCGNLVCAPTNGLKTECQHPVDVCSKEANIHFCARAPGCVWSEDHCKPEFDYTIIDPQVKAALPAPVQIRAANDGNADYLGLCEGFVGTVRGDPHIATFDRRKYDCMG